MIFELVDLASALPNAHNRAFLPKQIPEPRPRHHLVSAGLTNFIPLGGMALERGGQSGAA